MKARVVLSGPQGVALRVAPSQAATVQERYANGTILNVTCAVSAESVAVQDPTYRESPLWLRTQGGSYVSLLYLQVQGQSSMPNCQLGQSALTLTINGNG